MFSSLAPTKKYFLLTFVISCLLLEMFVFIIYNQSRLNKNSNDWVIHSYEVLRVGRLSSLDAIDMAANEQDYLITGYAGYLKTYQKALADLNQHLDELIKITSDDPEQTKNIASLRDKIIFLKLASTSHIDTVLNGHSSVYSMNSDAAATRHNIADVRTAFDAFSQKEAELLNNRRAAASLQQKNYIWTLLLISILGMGALVIANLIIFSLINKTTRSEDKLRKSEELFATILNGINDGVFDFDVANNTISYSPSYAVSWGYTQEELGANHDHFLSLIHPDDFASAEEIVHQYMAREISNYYSVFRIRHKNGNWIWVMSRGIGVWDKNGKMIRLIGTHTDITTQKQREEELNYFIGENERQRIEVMQAKDKADIASRAKSDFLTTMTHEIRTPMNAVIGLSHLLLETKLDSKQHEMVETLFINADILLVLVNDLLDLSRIEAGQVELELRPFSLESVFRTLHAILDGQSKAKGLTLELNNKCGDHTFIGDPTRIQQILTNLVGNAIKFTPKGSVTVTCESEPIEDDVAQIRISVSDTGVGIPEEKLDSIFEKFVQADQTISRRFGGSGLGLAICKSLAQLMGGDITVSSTLGEGSIFSLSVPLKINKIKKSASIVPELTITTPNAGGIVLIVEDYAPNVLVATLMLEHIGYGADIAKSGTEALEKIKARSMPYTAILMDVQMQGMDGLETTHHIRTMEKEKGWHHLIIGVTAHALAGDRDKCLDAGMDDYMSKPIHPDILAQKLNGPPKAA